MNTLPIYICMRLPNRKYTVASGANHLVFLSNQIDIPKINATVSLLIPEKYIPENMKAKIEDYENKEKTYRVSLNSCKALKKFVKTLKKNLLIKTSVNE